MSKDTKIIKTKKVRTETEMPIEIEKTVTKFSNVSHVVLPVSWIGSRVRVILLED